METERASARPPEPTYQSAKVRLRIGRRSGMAGSVRITDRGLLAVAVLVSSILLTTAVLVRVAVREGKGAVDR